ncbi:hypothetical protein C8J57DRAFT_1223746 [Mycena rebaudengoi]|nr:hypothetical protein C8J57DRAFT_1223746 [Mycena rebaudengoi]
MAPRMKSTSEPQVIQLADGTKFPTHYNNEKKTHKVSYDLCGKIINVRPAGTTSYRLESHRTACEKKIAKQLFWISLLLKGVSDVKRATKKCIHTKNYVWNRSSVTNRIRSDPRFISNAMSYTANHFASGIPQEGSPVDYTVCSPARLPSNTERGLVDVLFYLVYTLVLLRPEYCFIDLKLDSPLLRDCSDWYPAFYTLLSDFDTIPSLRMVKHYWAGYDPIVYKATVDLKAVADKDSGFSLSLFGHFRNANKERKMTQKWFEPTPKVQL